MDGRWGRRGNRAGIATRSLLVEDMDDLRESFAWLLRYAGCEVFAAPNGQEALGSVQGFTPELVLCLN